MGHQKWQYQSFDVMTLYNKVLYVNAVTLTLTNAIMLTLVKMKNETLTSAFANTFNISSYVMLI